MPNFSDKVLSWFYVNGRHDLPWQKQPTPYRVWISEIMLQQTQVVTVIPYFMRFINRFPTVAELAASDINHVLHLWTGLGYYARARNMHKAAQLIMKEYAGLFPTRLEDLKAMPGVGRSTAGAIAALSMNIRAPILDGNVKRVLTRYFAISGWPEHTSVNNELWKLAENLMPHDNIADYSQAVMDLGATLCTRTHPSCPSCPLKVECEANKTDTTQDYPSRKPKKKLPVKTIFMFILQNDLDEVLLEKRPPNGIWGSLYSLPESESSTGLPPLSKLVVEGERKALKPIRHTFSHYHLDISPIRMTAKHEPHRVSENDHWLWYPLDHSLEVGLAAPVKKLLSSLASNP